jgi:hypothetical protein
VGLSGWETSCRRSAVNRSEASPHPARAGAKYTTALRHEAGTHPLPPHLELFDCDGLPEGERMVVECLRALAAEGEPLTVRMAEPDPEVVEARMRAEEKGIAPPPRARSLSEDLIALHCGLVAAGSASDHSQWRPDCCPDEYVTPKHASPPVRDPVTSG